MKRRKFLKAAALGTAAGAVGSLVSGAEAAPTPEAAIATYAASPEVTHLLTLENDSLRVDIRSDASTHVLDKQNAISWQSGPVALQEYGPIDEGHVWLRQRRSMCEQYPGRFIGRRNAAAIDFLLLGRGNRIVGRFSCRVSLEDAWLVYRVTSIDEEIKSLVFPTPILSQALVLPIGVGKLVTELAQREIYERWAHTFFTHLNMRWIGGLNDRGGWIGIYDDGYEDAGAIVANRTAAPAWMKTLGRWRHPFVFRMRFLRGGYVELAKEYRKWFVAKGLFKSLQDKMAENAALAKLLGGRAVWITLAHPAPRKNQLENILFAGDQVAWKGGAEYAARRAGHRPGGEPLPHAEKEGAAIVDCTFARAKERFEKYEKLGMRRGLIHVGGWINRGYDASHPDIWPPEPKLGTIEELAGLLRPRRNCVVALHDNYMDVYDDTPSFPKGVIRQADGSLLTGGFWAGGQAYIMNYRDSLNYARRNWKKISTVAPQAMYIDTTTAVQLYQSYEKGNEYSKADDGRYKLELLRFLKRQGLLVGSEQTADFAIPAIDWFEVNHRRVAGQSIPLWPLVFHDAAFCACGQNDAAGYPGWLENMLYGTMLFVGGDETLDEAKFASTFHVDAWHGKIGTDEMLAHTFLAADRSVEETVFSSGARIVCNFGRMKYADRRGIVEPGKYLIAGS